MSKGDGVYKYHSKLVGERYNTDGDLVCFESGVIYTIEQLKAMNSLSYKQIMAMHTIAAEFEGHILYISEGE